jgi:Domain of unknown function (DUF1902)
MIFRRGGCSDVGCLLEKISDMAIDLLPDNHPGIEPGSVYLQLNALREAEPAAA